MIMYIEAIKRYSYVTKIYVYREKFSHVNSNTYTVFPPKGGNMMLPHPLVLLSYLSC